MNSPDKDPKSELDYAPPWAREQAAREQAVSKRHVTRRRAISFAPRFAKAAGQESNNWRKTTRKAAVLEMIGPGASVHWNPNWFRGRRPGRRIFGR